MSEPQYEERVSEPGVRKHLVRFVGGTTTVTKVLGKGITIAWISTGIVELTWSAQDLSPGTSHGIVGGVFQATTVSGVAGYTIASGVYNTTTRKLRVSIYNASDALADLAALQWVTFYALFVRA